MQLLSPIEAVHKALAAAVYRDLPDFSDEREFTIKMFPQVWGSTALGYGGVGGQIMTPAYTVIVESFTHACVYFGSSGKLAYRIDLEAQSAEGRAKFREDIQCQTMEDKQRSRKYL